MDGGGGVETRGASRGGDVARSGRAKRGGDDVADGGQDIRGVASSDPAGVVAVGDVADPVDAVVDRAVPPRPGLPVVLVVGRVEPDPLPRTPVLR